jgi:sensor histidine kinase YesM
MALVRRHSFYTKVFLTFSVIVAATVILAGLGFMRVLRVTITDYESTRSSTIANELVRNLDANLAQVRATIGDVVRRLSDESSTFRSVLMRPRSESMRLDRSAVLAFDEFFEGKLGDMPSVTGITVYATRPSEFHSYPTTHECIPNATLAATEAFQWVRDRPDFFELVRPTTDAPSGCLTIVTSMVNTDMDRYGVLAVHVDLESALGLSSVQDRRGRIVVTDRTGHLYLVAPRVTGDERRELARAVAAAGTGASRIETRGYFVVSRATTTGLLRLVKLIPLSETYQEVYRSRRIAAAVVLGLLAVSIAMVSYLSNHIASRVHRLGLGMRRLQDGEWGVQIPQGSDAGELTGLEGSFNRMSTVLQELVEREYISQMNLKQAQLVALQSQIRPHFLFNTLESIRLRMVQGGHHDEAQHLFLLSELFAAVLRRESMLIPLERELHYCESYLELNALRYGERLQATIDVDAELCGFYVPKLVLQPILENAVRHGLEQVEGRMEIRVTAAVTDKRLNVSVCDDGPGIQDSVLQDVTRRLEEKGIDGWRIGLPNVHHRIQTLFGKEYGMEIRSEVNQGTRVRVTMPVIEEHEADRYAYRRSS